MEDITTHVIRELAPTGVLRVAINLGNLVLAQRTPGSGALQGVSVDMAQELGRRLDLPVSFVDFASAGQVVEAVTAGGLDLMFLAVDPRRAEDILFTAPYVIIEGTYLVRAGSPVFAPHDLDRPGLRIAVGKGAAYDLFLSRTLSNAELVRAETSKAAVDLFVDTGLDAAAGVRQALTAFARTRSDMRVIERPFMTIEQAMGTPKGRPAARAYLQSFVEDLKSSGFVAAALAKSGRQDADVAPPRGTWPID